MKYFLDTYALVEIVAGNPAYARYTHAELFTSLLNLYELYYAVLRDYDQEKARKAFHNFYDILVLIQPTHIFAAAVFKLVHKKAHFSYADALGYTIAREGAMFFLTGDNQFKGFEHVEFVQ